MTHKQGGLREGGPWFRASGKASFRPSSGVSYHVVLGSWASESPPLLSVDGCSSTRAMRPQHMGAGLFGEEGTEVRWSIGISHTSRHPCVSTGGARPPRCRWSHRASGKQHSFWPHWWDPEVPCPRRGSQGVGEATSPRHLFFLNFLVIVKLFIPHAYSEN